MSFEPRTPRSESDAIEKAALELERVLPGKALRDHSLAPYTSFRVGGPAALFVEAYDESELEKVGVAVRGDLPILVLGRGTNVLVGDGGFHGVVIRTGRGFEWIRAVGEEQVEAGGAVALPMIANWAAKRSLSGMEFAVAIPATVGGAVRMNAGAHGSSISEVLERALVYRINQNAWLELSASDLGMTYRHTSLNAGDVVCSALFTLRQGSRSDILGRMDKHRKHRTLTQPSDAPNAGSMFKNPQGGAAGVLIERAGLKGYRVGGAEVSSKHANFFLARPGALAQDVYDLMAHVQSEVWDRFGVMLMPEVRMIGSFDERLELKTG
ncbi:MAG: UDP-N-acetylmuramate dehydrogenase [Actinomycetota bacterium]|nr:UDP-N-acetylmuramate dehydrogenase [Actinomycetota bacterium]